MSEIYTIENEFLSVRVSAQGAELQSIRSADGTEYLWQGDPAYWTDRSPVLFPYVGRLTAGKYTLDGQEHTMSIHGLALYLPFTLIAHSPEAMTFQLSSDAATRQQYPRDFSFHIHYRLEDSALAVEYEVENRDSKPMYFGLGGHPGFRVPLEQGLSFEDYRLRFSQSGTPIRVGFSETCFRNGMDTPFPLEDGCTLPLAHDLFDDDAIVLSEMAREVTLEAPGSSRRITVSYPQMPYLGLWHMPKTDAPYICIEPWCSLPARQDEIMALEEQPDLLRLEPGETHRNLWHIRISNH